MVRPALVAGALVVAALTAAAALAGPSAKRPQWRLSITGVQTLTWEMTSVFDSPGPGPCKVRHAGNQTIRFATSAPLPARLLSLHDVIFGDVLRAHVLSRGKWKGVVPLTGSEERRYRVLTPPPMPTSCDDEARPWLQDCSGTKPLAQGTGSFVDTRPPKASAQKLAMRVPVGTALQRSFPECPIIIFNLRNDWVYPLFTYNDWRPLVGGSPLSARTRRLTAHGTSTSCYEEGYPSRIDGTRCSNPHVAKISIDWRVTLSR